MVKIKKQWLIGFWTLKAKSTCTMHYDILLCQRNFKITKWKTTRQYSVNIDIVCACDMYKAHLHNCTYIGAIQSNRWELPKQSCYSNKKTALLYMIALRKVMTVCRQHMGASKAKAFVFCPRCTRILNMLIRKLSIMLDYNTTEHAVDVDQVTHSW